MARWTYQGIDIDVSERGDFTATVNGNHVRAGSLDTLKKKIREKQGFEPFTAINERTGAVCKVTGIQSGSYGWEWVVEDEDRPIGHRTASSVVRDTPENRAAYENYQATSKRNDAKIEALKQETGAARDKIVYSRVER